jgi:hypothetical protein
MRSLNSQLGFLIRTSLRKNIINGTGDAIRPGFTPEFYWNITIFEWLYIQIQRTRCCLLTRVFTLWNGFAFIHVRYSGCRKYSRWTFFQILIIAIHCVAGTTASTGTSVRNIDTGKQHDNNITTHNGFITYLFFIVDLIDFCSYMLLKWKANKLFQNSLKKGERDKITARIPGLIQGLQ